MPVHAVLSRSGKKDGEGLRTEEIVMIEEKMEERKVQLDKVRRAFRTPNLRGWIPRYLLTILEQGDAIVHHHFSYQTEWQRLWMEFLYLFCGFEDQTFLHMEHKTKKLKQQCQAICERLSEPDYEKLELEKALRACALLPSKKEMTDK